MFLIFYNVVTSFQKGSLPKFSKLHRFCTPLHTQIFVKYAFGTKISIALCLKKQMGMRLWIEPHLTRKIAV